MTISILSCPDNERWQEEPLNQDRKLYFSDDILLMNAGTLVLKKNKNQPESFIRNVGTITGFYPTLWKEQIAQGKVKIIEDTSPKILVKQLVTGIVDGLDIDLAVANYHLQELNLDEKVVISPNASRQVYAYKISTFKYPELIQEFNLWLSKNGKFIRQIKQRYDILAVEPNL